MQPASHHSASPPGRRHYEQILFCLMLLLALVPVWQHAYFLTEFGPSQVYNARLLMKLPGYGPADLPAQFYTLNAHTYLNWTCSILLGLLQWLFSPAIAEKILISLYVVGLPFSLRAFIKIINPRAVFLSFLAFPLIYNLPLQMGFYNFLLGVIIFLLIYRYWLLHKAFFSVQYTTNLALLFLLGYFTHPLGFIMAMIAAAVSSVVLSYVPWPRSRKQRQRSLRQLLSRIFTILLAGMPGFLMFAGFLARQKVDAHLAKDSVNALLRHLLEFSSLNVFNGSERFIALAYVVLLAFVLAYSLYESVRHKLLRRNRMFMAVSLVFLVIYFLSPESLSTGGLFDSRFQLFVALGLICLFATVVYKPLLKRLIVLLSCGIFVAFVFVRYPAHRYLSETAEEYNDALSHIEFNSLVLPLLPHFFVKNSWQDKPNVFRTHASDYHAADRSLVLMDNTEASGGFFPVAWKEGKDPSEFHFEYGSSYRMDLWPSMNDIRHYEKRAGHRLDYLLIENSILSGERKQDSYEKEILSSFRNMYTSPGGTVSVWKRM
jgi:hypothetical protein